MSFHRPASPNALADEPAEYFREATVSSSHQMTFHRPSSPSALADEPAEYFREAAISSPQQMTFNRPASPSALADEPAEYFREAIISSSHEMTFHRPASPNALADEPAEYFRSPTLNSPDQPAEYFRSPQLPSEDEPEEYFRPADPGSLDNEILFQHGYPESQLGMDDIYFPPFLPEHSSAENPQLDQLLQPLALEMPQAPVELGAGMELDDVLVGTTFPQAQIEGVYSELDARLFTALTGMQIPRENIQFDAPQQRHDCPGCNCGL
ncbi:hypothetical protein G7Y79_00012g031970 [Physcia stellaris]|nr:hypothetical protein G7Y79_00012g031970 [Physcia stellaris]